MWTVEYFWTLIEIVEFYSQNELSFNMSPMVIDLGSLIIFHQSRKMRSVSLRKSRLSCVNQSAESYLREMWLFLWRWWSYISTRIEYRFFPGIKNVNIASKWRFLMFGFPAVSWRDFICMTWMRAHLKAI